MQHPVPLPPGGGVQFGQLISHEGEFVFLRLCNIIYYLKKL